MPEEPQSKLDALAGADLPVGDLDTALLHLRRPFEPAAVRWKVQTAGNGWGIVVAYIDARLVVERLNLVVGDGWEDEYRPHSKDVEECSLSVYGITRRDVGTGSGMSAAKAQRSDSLKRAGVKFGIGISIYALKSVRLGATKDNAPDADRLLTKNYNRAKEGQKAQWTATMTPEAERWLSEKYGQWLEARGVPLFGPPLGHGDEEGAQGLEVDEAPAPAPEPTEEQATGPQLEDDRALALRDRANTAYAEIRALNSRVIPPALHKAKLTQAGVSHEALEALAVERESLLAEMKAKKEAKS